MTSGRKEATTPQAGRLGRRTVLTALGAAPLLAAVLPPTRAAAASTVAVDPSARRQTIRGFGGMNHPEWAGDLTAAQRETAFGNSAGQLGFSILRIHVDENQSNWSKEVATAQAAVAHGAIVFASPWNPPSSMTETFTRGSQTNAKRLRHDSYGAYAQHLNDFYTYMKGNGVDLYAISIQNEPDYASDWTWWTADEIVTFLRNNASAIGTKVIAPESFQYVKSMSDPILNDATALANLDVLGAHLYGTSYSNFPYPLFQQKGAGKELWMTEVYYPNSTDSADLWPAALGVGEHMHHAMVDAQFQAYVWWYIRRSYGPMREDGQISKRGAVMAQFAKFVRPGYVRLDATASPQSNVFTSAYTGDGKAVIVAVNKNSGTVSQPFTVSGAASGSVAAYVTDGSRTVAAVSGPGMSGGTFTASLPAQSITTFIVNLSTTGGSPTSLAGTYVITNKNSGLVLDTHNEGTTVGTLVNQNPADGGSSQTWTLIQAGSDLYKVQSKSSGLFLGITNMSTSNGSTALLWSDNGTADHLWRFVADSSGYYKIVNNNSGLVLGISTMSTSAGASVIQWADNGTADHLWRLTAR